MRTTFYLTSLLMLGLGALALAPGLVVLFYSYLTPMQPPPAIAEGPGLGRIVGWFSSLAALCRSLSALRSCQRCEPPVHLTKLPPGPTNTSASVAGGTFSLRRFPLRF